MDIFKLRLQSINKLQDYEEFDKQLSQDMEAAFPIRTNNSK